MMAEVNVGYDNIMNSYRSKAMLFLLARSRCYISTIPPSNV